VRHSSPQVLILGLFLAALFPSVSQALRPLLPALVALVLGLAVARLNLASVLADYKHWRKSLFLVGIVLLFMPVSCMLLVSIWRLLQLGESYTILLIVFAAAPPLGSATGLSLLLGYNARITLQVTLLATILTPVIGIVCLSTIGESTELNMFTVALKIFLMIAGGLAIGLAIQKFVGKQRIANNPDIFNGCVAITMVLFLFPLFDGVFEYVLAAPVQSILVLILASLLNIGGNLLVRAIGYKFTDTETANALGLIYGNRNVSLYLAALPINPLLSVFIAGFQIPMYITPALFGKSK